HMESCQPFADLFVIEIDDQGNFRDRKQLTNFLQFMRGTLGVDARPKAHSDAKSCDRASGRPPLNNKLAWDDVSLVVGAHGWRHNGRFNDTNLREMRDALFNASNLEHTSPHNNPSGCPRRVVGLFLAWRGGLWEESEKPADATSTGVNLSML